MEEGKWKSRVKSERLKVENARKEQREMEARFCASFDQRQDQAARAREARRRAAARARASVLVRSKKCMKKRMKDEGWKETATEG
jgi:hypothetical protein